VEVDKDGRRYGGIGVNGKATVYPDGTTNGHTVVWADSFGRLVDATVAQHPELNRAVHRGSLNQSAPARAAGRRARHAAAGRCAGTAPGGGQGAVGRGLRGLRPDRGARVAAARAHRARTARTEVVVMLTAEDAQRAGIGVVHQDGT
jgi:hypothetical protein